MGTGPPLSPLQRGILGALAVLPALAITLYFLYGDYVALSSPAWGGSQTRGAYVAMALAVKGALLAGITLGVVGLVRAWRALALAGVAVLVLAAIPLLLGGTGVLVLLSALMLFAATAMVTRRASGG
ncbi:MAG TPA: hypothetical protein VFH78_05080 [Candidatus Thermoplasmatota archaeon]|nr:hypothetical protein [Candidatus Thermoplasmatota archaeon]